MSLAPARTVAPRSSIVPAVACAPARNFSNPLRACSKLASAMERISLGISGIAKRSCPFSFMDPLLLRWQGEALLLRSPTTTCTGTYWQTVFAGMTRHSQVCPSWTFAGVLQHINARAAEGFGGNPKIKVIPAFGGSHCGPVQADGRY